MTTPFPCQLSTGDNSYGDTDLSTKVGKVKAPQKVSEVLYPAKDGKCLLFATTELSQAGGPNWSLLSLSYVTSLLCVALVVNS